MAIVGQRSRVYNWSSASPIFEFQGHEPGNRDGKIEWPNNRFQIGKAAGERVHGHDVPVPGRGQVRQAEIDHRGEIARSASQRREAGEGGGVQSCT